MAAKAYSNFPLNLGGSASSGGAPMDFLSDTLQFSLHNSYTPAQTTHILYATSGVSSTELAATGGYSTGGYVLAAKTWTVSSLTSTFDNTTDPNWTSASFTCDTGILWDNTPSTPLDPLICYDNFGTQTVTAATFTYVVAATGFFTIAVS
jgi:hypothetical protein